MNNKNLYWVLLFTLFLSCADNKVYLLEELSDELTHISFINRVKDTQKLSILDYLYFYNGGGVSIGDINNDGWQDIYFTSNLDKNVLYLNKGNFEFEDITVLSGTAGKGDWTTGTTMVDINGDGWLDIYVCYVSGIYGFDGHNELYINNKNSTFTEMAKEYGLDIENYSSTATFFDYDLDGDLDLYLLNHAIHTQESYGKVTARNKRDDNVGDKLLRNDDGIFKDVSEQAGIFGGVNGYGLGVAVSDFNWDGFPDIYVSNDFHEDDYFYLNNGNGTFLEKIKTYFGHISRFSMGCDVADVNHDNYPDIMTLDMLPEEEKILKKSAGDEKAAMLKFRTNNLGYHYQYSRNMLQINRNGDFFTETALMNGISSTDWSWGVLFVDFNQDGFQDVFISNGIPKRPNDLDYIKYISNKKIKQKLNNTKLMDKKALEMMPSGLMYNYIFEGNSKMNFLNRSSEWLQNKKNISNGISYADLDNDGDLDLVSNNINTKATVYKNNTNQKNNYLKILLHYKNQNRLGIGSKVIVYYKGNQQFKELYLSRGFQSSVEPVIHFGLAKEKKIDSLLVVWPDKTYQILKNIHSNQTLNINYESNQKQYYVYKTTEKKTLLFEKVTDNLGIDFTHKENDFIDFDWKRLTPYKTTDRSPSTAVGDINQDGKIDVFFGSSRYNTSQLYLQENEQFVKSTAIKFDSLNEIVDAVIADFDKNGFNDLLTVSGGQEYYILKNSLKNHLYSQNSKGWNKSILNNDDINNSIVKPFDYDQDGDLDLFIGAYSDFKKNPSPYPSILFKNENGKFTKVKSEIEKLSRVTDAVWTDFDNDGLKDLITVGEWTTPSFFKNSNGILHDVSSEMLIDKKLTGLWQCIIPFDIDHDGDLDYILGNWGTNTKFKASKEKPLKMYFGEIGKGNMETLVAISKNNKYYPINSFDELSAHLLFFRKKYNTYNDFAGKTIQEVLNENKLNHLKVLEVHNLESGYLKNDDNQFTFIKFDKELQVAPIKTGIVEDFDRNGEKELLVAGNYFGITPYHGRFDGFSGALINNEKKITLGNIIGLNLFGKSARKMNVLNVNKKKYLLVTYNNEKIEVYKIRNSN